MRPSCTSTTRPCCEAARCSRRCACTAADRSASTRTSTVSRRRRPACICRSRRARRSPTRRTLRSRPGASRTPGWEGERSPRGFVLVSALPPGLDELRARGLRLVTTPWAAGALAGAKSTSYAENMVAQEEAVRSGADDALFVAPDGTVLEAPTANVWFRRGDTLFTPALSLRLLSGVTRGALCDLAPGLGYAVEEGRYSLEDLLGSDEVFLSSSIREVMPVVAVDGRGIAAGPAAAALQAGLRKLAAGYPGET